SDLAEPKFFIDPKHIRNLEIASTVMHRTRLTDTDEPATARHIFTDSRRHIRIKPMFTTRKRRPGITDIQYHVDIIRNTPFTDIIKTDELNINRRTAQRLQNTQIRIRLL